MGQKKRDRVAQAKAEELRQWADDLAVNLINKKKLDDLIRAAVIVENQQAKKVLL